MCGVRWVSSWLTQCWAGRWMKTEAQYWKSIPIIHPYSWTRNLKLSVKNWEGAGSYKTITLPTEVSWLEASLGHTGKAPQEESCFSKSERGALFHAHAAHARIHALPKFQQPHGAASHPPPSPLLFTLYLCIKKASRAPALHTVENSCYSQRLGLVPTPQDSPIYISCCSEKNPASFLCELKPWETFLLLNYKRTDSLTEMISETSHLSLNLGRQRVETGKSQSSGWGLQPQLFPRILWKSINRYREAASCSALQSGTVPMPPWRGDPM